ncbi:MAG: nucleotidyltransferase [Clostridiales bacterium]|nr:nucleotidyltransferase [Clostridiales bacterium]
MKTVGIIAEYNPFHNGHLYQINKIKEITNADYVIVVMSGNYVQRGTPAILHKYARTQMALLNHVDAVFELPVCYATASAEYFAYGAISLLQKLGVVDYLCFGSECGDITLLQTIAQFLINEPDDYKEALLRYQKSGETYPKARAMAIIETLKESSDVNSKELYDVLTSPNNILGIEYLKALNKLDSTMEPITILRKGAGYHSEEMEEVNPSATAIRKHLIEYSTTETLTQLPNSCINLLKELYQVSYPMTADDFSSLLYYQLSQKKDQLTSYQDVSGDLANRIQNLLVPNMEYTSFTDTLKTKQLTLTRINRSLLHILLNLKQSDFETFQMNNIMYARLLGFRKESSGILKEIQNKRSCPLITKVADARVLLSDHEYKMFLYDINASHLYDQMIYMKFKYKMKDEYTFGPVII